MLPGAIVELGGVTVRPVKVAEPLPDPLPDPEPVPEPELPVEEPFDWLPPEEPLFDWLELVWLEVLDWPELAGAW